MLVKVEPVVADLEELPFAVLAEVVQIFQVQHLGLLQLLPLVAVAEQALPLQHLMLELLAHNLVVVLVVEEQA
jgi:hypothetical protein